MTCRFSVQVPAQRGGAARCRTFVLHGASGSGGHQAARVRRSYPGVAYPPGMDSGWLPATIKPPLDLLPTYRCRQRLMAHAARARYRLRVLRFSGRTAPPAVHSRVGRWLGRGLRALPTAASFPVQTRRSVSGGARRSASCWASLQFADQGRPRFVLAVFRFLVVAVVAAGFRAKCCWGVALFWGVHAGATAHPHRHARAVSPAACGAMCPRPAACYAQVQHCTQMPCTTHQRFALFACRLSTNDSRLPRREGAAGPSTARRATDSRRGPPAATPTRTRRARTSRATTCRSS